jgi:carbonic anhydrase
VFNSDPIKIAGGAKALACPEHESDREFLLSQLRKSIQLHGAKRIVLMLHSDCGAYGGLAKFGGDRAKERENHAVDMRQAKANLEKEIPGIPVEGYFVDFEGVWNTD